MRIFCFLFLAVLPVGAQVGTAVLAGLVIDPAGSSVPNATVTLDSVSQKYTRVTTTNTAGEYRIAALPPGEYKLTIAASGFAPATETGIVLTSGQASTVDKQLAVAGSTQQMTVTEAPPLLETETATLGTTIPQRQVVDLPVLGGSFLNLLSVGAGVAPVPPAGSTTNYSPVGQSTMPSVYGQRQKDNNFTIDGVENRDPNLLGIPLYPPPEAIAEMKMESGMSSGVYGHASGATINVVTKSGSNEWHGAGWEFFRNNDLDARSFFLPAVGAYHWNQFGGDIGGPLSIPKLIPKEKAWYIFGYYEGVIIHNAANYTALVPTPAEIGGNFAGLNTIYNPFTTAPGATGGNVRQPFPNNQIPTSLIDPSTQLIAKTMYPAPNLPPGQIPGANFLSTSPNVADGDQWDARVDHQFGKNDSFFGRYTDARNPSHGSGLPSEPGQTVSRLTNAEVSDSHTFSPTFLVTGRFSMMRVNAPSMVTPVSGLASNSGSLAVFPAFHGLEVFPPLSINGYTGLSEAAAFIGPLYQNSWILDGQKVKSKHTIEFGGSIVHSHIITDNRTDGVTFTQNPTSNFAANTGDGFATFLLGTPDTVTRNAGNTEGLMHGNVYSLYVQDDWRATRRLTLNLGLRWDYASPLINDFGLGTFVWETGQYVWDQKNPITGAPANIRQAGIPPDYKNFAPRVGLAYQLTNKTVIRSGYGIFFDTFGSNYVQTQQSPRGNWPFAFPQTATGLNTAVPNAIFPNVLPGPPTGSTVPLGCQQCLNVATGTSRTPYVQEWTFSIQQELASNFVFESDYFGSHGIRLTGQIVDNTAIIPGPGPISARQKDPQFPPYVDNGFNVFPSWYHGLSLKLTKRLSYGLSMMVSYTWSKTEDESDNLSNASLGGNPTSNATRFNLAANKGLAGFDIPQNFVTSFVYTIPGKTHNRLADFFVSDWNTSAIIAHYSGLPFSVFLGTDVANIGTVSGRYTQYPELVGNPNAIAVRTPQEWFNIAAFAQPALYTFGNTGRNILRTDSETNVNFSLFKRFPFMEKRDVEIRGDFFDLLNQTAFGYPSDVVGTSTFGKVSNTRNSGRLVQLAVKIHF